MEEKVFSVVELNTIIKRIFDAEEFLHGILMTGEVSNFKISGNHAYFNLKDSDAQIFCTFFNIKYADNTVVPKNGDKVIVRGTPDFYVKGGSLSFKVTKIQPEGKGALYLKFLELKEKLEKEGLFDEKKKKPIPKSPKRVGVVTSRTGAVIRDIINVTRRRNPFTDIVLYPVKVQGEGAEYDVAKGVKALDESGLVECIIVGRGGGSMEDLMAFNTEVVARAVYECKTPIISAVGHETDFSLCDFASDLRAPTPSAAAELSTVDLMKEARDFAELSRDLERKFMRQQTLRKTTLDHSVDKLKILGQSAITKGENKVKSDLNKTLNLLRIRFMEKQNALKMSIGTIDNLNPLKMLDKGFAKVSVGGKAVKTVKDIKTDDVMTTYLLGGEVKSRVTEILEDKK